MISAGGCLWVSVKICVYIYVYEQFVLVCVCFSFLPGATDVESSHCCSGHNQAVATALFSSSRYGEDIQVEGFLKMVGTQDGLNSVIPLKSEEGRG